MRKEKVSFKIERAEEGDLDRLAELYLVGYRGLEEYSYTHPKDVRAYMRWLWRRDPEGIFVAKANGDIVGFVAGDANWFSKREHKKVGAIHEIVVHPDYRGAGIGRALMEKILDYFREKGLHTAELWVGDENYRAIDFYRNFGFKEKGQYNYWVRMTRELNGSKAL
ncbi:N-acetyltransferase family protein [Hydrogenivirga sp.]